MVLIEATGGPLACSRCDCRLPPDGGAGWGSLMMNGRLVLVTCPDCLTSEERAQVAAREGASLYEVAPGRRADPELIGLLVTWARGASRQAPPPDWAEDLAEDAVGVIAGEPEGGWLRALFAAPGRHGRRRLAMLDVETAHWVELEEVIVPAWVLERAQDLYSRHAT